MKRVKFSMRSVLPKSKKFFQNLKKKDISYTILPEGDYSFYDFSNVCIKGTVFTENSKLPMDYNFFQKVKYKDCRQTILPLQIISNLEKYNLRGVQIDLSIYDLTSTQLFIIKKKLEH